jgi:hypothetical protein
MAAHTDFEALSPLWVIGVHWDMSA